MEKIVLVWDRGPQVWGTKGQEYPALPLGVLSGLLNGAWALDNLVLFWVADGEGEPSSVLDPAFGALSVPR